MKKVLLAATAVALVAGPVPAPAGAEATYSYLAVDVLGADGSVTEHKQLKCPRYEDCTGQLPFELQGKKQTLYVKARVPDEHHIYVIVNPDLSYALENGQVRQAPFDVTSETKAFEAGNEWTTELHSMVRVARDPSKPRLKWDKATTELRWLTVLKLRMKLES
jgi:hypothetical protein